MPHDSFPILPGDWEPTRATLHAYSRAATAIARTHAAPHPKWWHASLKVSPTGLVSEPASAPGGGALTVAIDFEKHSVEVAAPSGSTSIDMQGGTSGTEMADAIIAVAAENGIEGDIDRSKFESDEPREYDPSHAETFWQTLRTAHGVFEAHRASLEGEVGPVQLWPHGFDLAFEWFGTRTQSYEEGGETKELPAQLNLGFYPAGDAYFYSNPWPFDESLLESPLPHGASWHTEGWQGSMLPYAALAGGDDGPARLAEFAAEVHRIAKPTLLA